MIRSVYVLWNADIMLDIYPDIKVDTMADRKREYQKTHPWIDFKFEPGRLPVHIWTRLGQISAKCEQIANVLLPPKQSRQINRMYFAKGVAATAAIEGNTLSEKEVGERIKALDKGEKPPVPRSQEYRTQEIDNITQACHDVAEQVFDKENPASMVIADIENYNARLLEKLPPAEGSPPSKIRQSSVVVGRYRGAPAGDCRFLLERLCGKVEDWRVATSEDANADTITFAVLRAIYAHLYLAWIHPFADGNGRTARLVEYRILIESGVPQPSAQLLSTHYNLTRPEYYRHLDEASKRRNPYYFIEYAINGLLDGLDEQLKVIQNFHREIIWRDTVYRTFNSHLEGRAGTKANQRRRELALALVPKALNIRVYKREKIRHLTPELAELYAGKGDKVITRDLNILKKMRFLWLVDRNNVIVLPQTLSKRKPKLPTGVKVQRDESAR